jgi:hypothetical protein
MSHQPTTDPTRRIRSGAPAAVLTMLAVLATPLLILAATPLPTAATATASHDRLTSASGCRTHKCPNPR